MTFNVVLPGVLLANVRYQWLTDAGFGAVLNAGIADAGAFSVFIIDATPPTGAIEIFAYDVNDTSNFSRGNYLQVKIKEAVAFLRNKWTVAGGVLTVYDDDEITVLWTSNITSDATAIPVTGLNPV